MPKRVRIARLPTTVWASGPGIISTKGRTLHFEAYDLEPEETDNVYVEWGLVTDAEWRKRLG